MQSVRNSIGGIVSRFSNQASTVAGGRTPPDPTSATAIQSRKLIQEIKEPGDKTEIATFANGCFWGTEHIFNKFYKTHGIIRTAVGYTGGYREEPSYEEVCSGRTGHAESVQVVFNPDVVGYAELVEFFYRTHDPTTLNSQGNDRGTQYRSSIFTNTPEQLEIAQQVTQEVQKDHFDPVRTKIVTAIEPAGKWYTAEEYHQKYLDRNIFGYQCPTHRLHW